MKRKNIHCVTLKIEHFQSHQEDYWFFFFFIKQPNKKTVRTRGSLLPYIYDEVTYGYFAIFPFPNGIQENWESVLKSMGCVFFQIFIYFNWRLIILQYCGGFCHTLTWISHGCTCVPHPEPLPIPSPSHPSGFSQCTGFECPVSCFELGLVIYFTYGNIHVSVLFLQIIQPLPYPT